MPFRRPVRPGPAECPRGQEGSRLVLDVAYLVGGCAFFVLAVLYTHACERL